MRQLGSPYPPPGGEVNRELRDLLVCLAVIQLLVVGAILALLYL